jgi:hypothetical protein
MGGLAAAAALAQHAGLKVAVLERQVTPGGYLQSFSRKGYTWETGVHAIGARAPAWGTLHGGLLCMEAAAVCLRGGLLGARMLWGVHPRRLGAL